MPTELARSESTVDPPGPDAETFRQFMSQWPTGVTVVTTADGGTPLGCTVNAMMSVSLTPPLLMVALTEGSGTLRCIQDCGRFALNVLTTQQRWLCERFARGDQRTRFREVPYRWQHDMPLLDGVAGATVCEVRHAFPCGDHVVVVGAPRWHTSGASDAPLVFCRRDYPSLVTASPDGWPR